jgi:hypothetical protein
MDFFLELLGLYIVTMSNVNAKLLSDKLVTSKFVAKNHSCKEYLFSKGVERYIMELIKETWI